MSEKPKKEAKKKYEKGERVRADVVLDHVRKVEANRNLKPTDLQFGDKIVKAQ